VLLTLSVLLAVVLGFVAVPPERAVNLVDAWGYHVVLLTVVLFAFWLCRTLDVRHIIARWCAGGWKIVLLVIAVSAVSHIQEPHGFKIVNDEIVQLSTSLRMHELREASMVQRGYSLGPNFVLFQGDLDKRPLLFPFLVATLHDLTGYRPENSFIFNAILTPVLFGLLYLVARGVNGVGGGVSAVLLFVTIPLVTQTIASGSFEALNLGKTLV